MECRTDLLAATPTRVMIKHTANVATVTSIATVMAVVMDTRSYAQMTHYTCIGEQYTSSEHYRIVYDR